MWLIDIYSKGDTMSDDYLLNRSTDEFLLDVTTPKYKSSDDVEERIEFLTDVVERANHEIELLKKYNSALVGAMSWRDVLD